MADHEGHSHGHGEIHLDDEVSHTIDLKDTVPIIRDLFYAANVGDMALLKQFIEEERVDVNSRGEDDITALHWACYKGHLDIVKYLLDRKAEIDAPNRSEAHTPLMWASIAGYIKIVHYLLEHGADVNRTDNRGYNALHHAVQYNQNVVAHFLLEKGLYIDARDNEGHTALLWAAYTNHEEAVRYVLSQGADINVQDNGGCSALHWAAAKGNMSVVKAVLSNGKANPSLKDREGCTPSQTAERKQHFKIAKVLKEAEKLGSNSTPLSEKSLIFLWFFVSFLGIQYTFFVLVNFPNFFVGIIVVILTMYGIRHLLGHLWLDVNHRNPCWVGVVVSAYAISVYCFFTNVYWTTSKTNPMETIIFTIANMVFGPLYLKLLYSNPGYIRNTSTSSANEWKLFLSTLEKDEPVPGFCLTCMVRKPIRAKHCRTCNQCIARFDHHCGWINNCVGVENHFPFLIALGLVIANHFMFIHFCTVALGSLEGAPSLLPANHSIPFYFQNEPLILVLMFFHFGNVFWQTWLAYSLLNALRLNVTTNETINGNRYDYLKDPVTGQYKNPFNQGIAYNVKDVVNPSIDWYHIFTVPKHLYMQ